MGTGLFRRGLIRTAVNGALCDEPSENECCEEAVRVQRVAGGLHEKAFQYVRDEFDTADGMRSVPVESLNRGAPGRWRYASAGEVFRQWLSCADATARFAVDLGLVSAVGEGGSHRAAAKPQAVFVPEGWPPILQHFAAIASKSGVKMTPQYIPTTPSARRRELPRLPIERVREEYERITRVINLGLDAINSSLPGPFRYRSIHEVERDWSSRAGAVSGMAVSLGLISSEEAAQIIRELQTAHPELWVEGDSA